MTTPAMPPELTLLPIPVPPNLVTICGYPKDRDAGFVALYWNGGDEIYYNDGQVSGTGATYVFLAYRRHPAVAKCLDQYNIGYSDLEADDYLVIDRENNQAYMAPIPIARAFLQKQHPPPPELTPYEQEEAARENKALVDDLIQSLAVGWNETCVDPEAVIEHMRQEQTTITRLVAWLDQQHPKNQENHPL